MPKMNLVWSQTESFLQKLFLRVVAHPTYAKLIFFLAYSNLWDEIPFKGGILSHSKSK
jgi:hypothetical protein